MILRMICYIPDSLLVLLWLFHFFFVSTSINNCLKIRWAHICNTTSDNAIDISAIREISISRSMLENERRIKYLFGNELNISYTIFYIALFFLFKCFKNISIFRVLKFVYSAM